MIWALSSIRSSATRILSRAASTSFPQQPQQTSVTDSLQSQVQKGVLRPDQEQLRAASVLDKLLTVAEAIRTRKVMAGQQEQEFASVSEGGDDRHGGRQPAAGNVSNDRTKSTAMPRQFELPAICGAYLWGGVGTGSRKHLPSLFCHIKSN